MIAWVWSSVLTNNSPMIDWAAMADESAAISISSSLFGRFGDQEDSLAIVIVKRY